MEPDVSVDVITTCTRDCPSACGQIARVTNGRVTSLEGNPDHPVIRGRICGKARRYLERVYSPHRVCHPLRRAPSGVWETVSWEDALDEVATRMVRLRREHGAESILYYQGFGIRTALQLLNERFFNRFGGGHHPPGHPVRRHR